MAEAAATPATGPVPTTIAVRTPSKYAPSSSSSSSSSPSPPTPPAFAAPPLDWLHRTWAVTHSTLSMWRTAQNVRITYAPLAPHPSSGLARVDDLVEYESNKPGRAGVKTVAGVDTASSAAGDDGAWDWRGKGWLFFVSSHWEVLGWGERPLAGGAGVERWVVTWFAPTLFTKEGVDFYSDRPEGLSEETAATITAALAEGPLAEMVKKDMQAVDIKLPWQEK